MSDMLIKQLRERGESAAGPSPTPADQKLMLAAAAEIVRLRGLVTRLRHPLGRHVFLMAPSDGFCIMCDRVENDPIHQVGP